MFPEKILPLKCRHYLRSITTFLWREIVVWLHELHAPKQTASTWVKSTSIHVFFNLLITLSCQVQRSREEPPEAQSIKFPRLASCVVFQEVTFINTPNHTTHAVACRFLQLSSRQLKTREQASTLHGCQYQMYQQQLVTAALLY